MVLSFTFSHTFKYPVNLVINAYRLLHTRQNEVKIDEEGPEEDSAMTCTKRTISMMNPFPKFFQRVKLLKLETIMFFEDIWTQGSENRVWIRSRNLTWEDEISIGNVVYLSQSDNNQSWTTWEDATALDFQYCGTFGLILELYLKRKLESTKMINIKTMESILDQMQRDGSATINAL